VETFTIEISERPDMGKSASNRCRREGFIPGVAYHRHEGPIAVKVPYKQFTILAGQARRTQVFTFKSSSAALNGKAAIVKEIQRDYVKGHLVHVDFQTIKEDEELNVDVALKLVGEAPGVKVQNGILTFVTHELTVRCLPKNIPSVVEVDISSLGLGQSIHAGDVKLPEGVVLAGDAEATVASVVAARQTEEVAAAEAAPAAGAAPAADAAPAAAAGAKAPAAKTK
jgi:large subunit ribosomal protein L25